MFKKALKLAAFFLIVFAVVAFLQPDDFKIERSVTISAPVTKIFMYVNNLEKFNAWSPWAKLNPNAKNNFEGPIAGEGAIMRWEGDAQVGAGSMEIIKSKTNESVEFDLEFLKPMKGSDIALFTFKPEGNQTMVTWSMYGKKDFLAKAVGLLFNCEKMVGGQFEKGLRNLKSVAERK